MASMETPIYQMPTSPMDAQASAAQADELSDDDLEFVVGGDPLQQLIAA